MRLRLSGFYRATTVPEALRSRQCRVCRAPVDEPYNLCYQCKWGSSCPDLAGFVTYAVKGGQSGTEMRGYKSQCPSPQAVSNVWLLLEHGLSHLHCAGHLVGQPVDAVAVVPSRSHYQPGTQSMLQRLCDRALPDGMPLVDLRPTPGSTSDRRMRDDAFEVVDPPGASHVMLIDDTWVSGGTALSAVASLRYAGVPRVSTLIVARWLDRDYVPTRKLVAEVDRIRGWEDPLRACPFTLDGSCPSRAV